MGRAFFAPCVTRMVAGAAVEGTDLDIKLCLILVTGYVLDSGWPTFWGAMWDGRPRWRPRLAPSLAAGPLADLPSRRTRASAAVQGDRPTKLMPEPIT
jgi:hypothetical protein